jgi:hypothetical protein
MLVSAYSYNVLINTEEWAIIAELELPKNEIIEEAKYALEIGEIDFTDYCKILSHLQIKFN